MKIALFARDFDINWSARVLLIIKTLIDEGVQLCFYEPFYHKVHHLPGLVNFEHSTFNSYSDLPQDTDLFLCLGGDGTFLESLTFIRDKSLPIAGVNFGRLGFLTSADINSPNGWISDLIQGKYSVEKRTILQIENDRLPSDFFPYAVNEVSIQKIDSKMISVVLRIDGIELPAYWSDGLVVATPTGSTAYSLSIGGPIVMPFSKVWTVAPIAPHNLNVRPMIVPDDVSLEMSANSRSGKVILCLDSREFILPSGSPVKIKKADFPLKYISLQEGSFINALKDKLRWGEDKRNIQSL